MSEVFLLAVQTLTLGALLFGLFKSVKRRRLYAALFAGLALYHVLSLPALQYYIGVYGIDVVGNGVLIALAGTCSLLITIETLESIFARDRAADNSSFIDEVVAQPGFYLFIAVAAFALVVLIGFGRGIALLESNWEEIRSDLGFLDSVAILLQFVAFPLCWILFRLGKRTAAALFFFLAIAVFSANGSRAALLTIPAVVALDFYRRGLLFTRRYALVGGSLLLVFVLIVHVGGRMIRGLGMGGMLAILQGDFSSALSIIDNPEPIDWTGGESGVNHYYFFVIREGAIYGVDSLSTVFRWLTMYLPRSVAPDFKPIDPTYSLWVHAANSGLFDGESFTDHLLDLLRQGDMGSIHSLFWGEAWMNGGVAALATMTVVLGIIVVLIDRFYSALPVTVVALLAPATVVGYLMVARGNSVIGLGYIAYLMPPIFIGYLLLELLYKKNMLGNK